MDDERMDDIISAIIIWAFVAGVLVVGIALIVGVVWLIGVLWNL
jgi:hypothetical protein